MLYQRIFFFFEISLFPLCRQLLPVNPLLFPDSLLSPPSITLLYRKDQASIPSFSFSCLTNFTSLWCQKEVEPFSSARLPVPLQRGQCAAGTQCFPGRGEESALISKVGEFHMEQQLVSLCLFKTKHLLPWPGLIFFSNPLLSRLHRKFAFLLLTQLRLVP